MGKDEKLIRNVAKAEIVAVAAHPKQPGMYRVAIRSYGENEEDSSHETALSTTGLQGASVSEDWSDEVDAFLAGAAQATSTGRNETVVTVHEDTLVGMRLLKGRRLSAEEWDTLQREEDQEDAYRAALTILERKARTTREISEALKRKGYSPDVIRSCIERLQSRRMLDDASYAQRYAEQRAAGQRKGRRLIRQELLQRGIAKNDADEALGKLDGSIEREAAYTLAHKKWPQLKGELRQRKMKLVAFLLRRGYPNSIAKEALERAIAEASGMEDTEAGFGYEPEDSVTRAPDWE